ncbi:hypothetical protein [Sediminibacterium ginsengisoli]|uniref:Uncharacterized protein n=1 Tax=Sediminibacterium ginsengisoli TaxID=413434 RepID=A0A1T4M9J3_9BACT|nr:hypothetical protein [Sediminibacterium ginsengisoli]SJZ63581.1 hypothetical protein SAMN04488132_103260 [Sediminibacterium ginsengisoli]
MAKKPAAASRKLSPQKSAAKKTTPHRKEAGKKKKQVGGLGFVHRLDPDVAAREVYDFRQTYDPTGSYGVWYTREQIYDYVKPGGIYDKLIAAEEEIPDTQEWVVGFYFRTTIVENEEKLTFLVAPLKRFKNSDEIIDRFYSDHVFKSVQPTKGMVGGEYTGGEDDLYDSGNMWP